ISQPHVRPIVRGKTNARVEFGAKLSVSVIDGYAFLDVLSWDSYHEGKGLRESVDKYKERYGYYPEAVLADTIYRTRAKRAYCRSEERRVGKECRSRWPRDGETKREKNTVERRRDS